MRKVANKANNSTVSPNASKEIYLLVVTVKAANHSLPLNNTRPSSYNSIIDGITVKADPKNKPSFLRSRMFPLLRLRQGEAPGKRSSAEVTRFAWLELWPRPLVLSCDILQIYHRQLSSLLSPLLSSSFLIFNPYSAPNPRLLANCLSCPAAGLFPVSLFPLISLP